MTGRIRHRRLRRRVALAAALVAALTGCGIRPDAAPRDVPQEKWPLLSDPSSRVNAEGVDRIYLVGPGENPLLRSVPRQATSPGDLFELLFLGPSDAELQKGFSSALPPTLRLNSTRRQGGLLFVDVSSELREAGGTSLVQAIAQIVYTASELEGIQSVLITVDGEPVAWPRASQSSPSVEPLRVYDYPGLVLTAQPAYPAVPSA